eukprot:Nk52_evm6s255 gene=Nk52_evmTU6s255
MSVESKPVIEETGHVESEDVQEASVVTTLQDVEMGLEVSDEEEEEGNDTQGGEKCINPGCGKDRVVDKDRGASWCSDACCIAYSKVVFNYYCQCGQKDSKFRPMYRMSF